MTRDEYEKLCDIELLFIDDDTVPAARGELHKFLMVKKEEIVKRIMKKTLISLYKKE